MSDDDYALDDAALLDQLKQMWEEVDPAPPDLPDRVLFALQLADMECEVLRILHAEELVGARSAATVDTVSFGSDLLTVMLRLPGPAGPAGRLDGWIAPGAALRVELRTGSGRQETVASPEGRFAFTDVPSGFCQLVLHPTEGAAVTLTHPLVTPAIQL
jgi:hypothetical protein